jgi:hypothetical protein
MPDHFDISPPLRDINVPPVVEANDHERPLHMPRPPRSPSGAPDPVVQSTTGALVNATAGVSFDGVGANGYAPPDTNMAVGPNHIVQWVNVRFAVYHKDGTILAGYPKGGNAIWSGFGGDCEFKNGGDPIAQYDAAHDRWLMTQLGSTSNPYSQCIAVSTSGDPTGTYARYQYNYGSTLNDYPKFGIWPDAYYASYNLFYGSSGGQACAYDSAAMRSGLPAQSICFTKSNDYSLLPSDLDGATPPPAGSPNYFLTTWSSTSLNLYKFHVDFATPANSTFTGPTSITVASYSEACGGGACIPQLGTSTQLDSLADRPMYRLAYRKFSDHEALVVNHAVTAGSAVGVRWYEIRDPNGTPTVYQQGTFAPGDGNYRWMGSAAMDQAGDIAIGYSVSSGSMHPSIAYTGRAPTDPLGTMGAEATIINGGGSQTGGLSRWGDYSALRIDPSDDCTFWYTNQYLKADGSFNWSTRIASFKFAGCGGPPPTPPDGAPDGLATTLVAYNEVDLHWNDHSTNENGFQILRCTGAGCTPTTAIGSVGTGVTSYNDTTVAASTTYTYKVLAYNGGGTVDCVNPATVSATTPAPPALSPPTAPSNLSVIATSKNWIYLSWQDNSNNETNFDIERCAGATCTNFAALTSVGANVTTFRNTGLVRHTTYRYRVKARNSSGSSTYAGPVSGTTN